MVFPQSRPRRLRATAAVRSLVSETTLRSSDLIAPLFVAEGIDQPREIPSLPGVFQHTVSSLLHETQKLLEVGVRAVMLFGVPLTKDQTGSGAWAPDGLVQQSLSALRQEFGDELVLMSDLCLDEYTDHGHCGVVRDDGSVDNDATLRLYARTALAQARAGATMVAPSGMMDGQVGAIREALDAEGLSEVGIVAYSVKYASALYGPFRDAVNVAIADGGDRRSYQQDFHNIHDARREVLLDIDEGADMVMVKPAVTYLDVIAKVREFVDVPVLAYHVSGEYAMIQAAARQGWIDGQAVALEQLVAVRRAGATAVLTYFAGELAPLL